MKKILALLTVFITLTCALNAEIKLGLQAYTFRKNTLMETLQLAENLGIKYLQAYPGQIIGGGFEQKFGPGAPQEARAAVLDEAKKRGIKIVSFGVTGLKDEQGARAVLAFAKEMGITQVWSEPKAEMLPILNLLGKQYGVTVGCHNHPKGSIYSIPAEGIAAVKPYQDGGHVLLAPDTGHWLRAGFDPVEYLKAARGLIAGAHFKDLMQDKEKPGKFYDVPFGSGISNIGGQLAELRRQNFDGILYLEYEKMDKNLYEGVAKCVDWFKRAMKASVEDLDAGKVPAATEVPEALKLKEGSPLAY